MFDDDKEEMEFSNIHREELTVLNEYIRQVLIPAMKEDCDSDSDNDNDADDDDNDADDDDDDTEATNEDGNDNVVEAEVVPSAVVSGNVGADDGHEERIHQHRTTSRRKASQEAIAATRMNMRAINANDDNDDNDDDDSDDKGDDGDFEMADDETASDDNDGASDSDEEDDYDFDDGVRPDEETEDEDQNDSDNLAEAVPDGPVSSTADVVTSNKRRKTQQTKKRRSRG